MESKTCYELFGIECGSGWKSLYQPIIDYVEEWNKSHESKIKIIQIKEKFAGLRIYVENPTEELNQMIYEAELKSFYMCEDCGSTENIGTIGNRWYRTLCRNCAQKQVNNTGKSQLFRLRIRLEPEK